MDFSVEISNLSQLVAALIRAPEIAAPILKRALVASQAILAKYTNTTTVPFRTGFLIQTFAAFMEPGKLHWYPTASYARFVEFGTAPHMIYPKEKQALFWDGADHPVRSVRHPGTARNPYMERILEAATSDINDTFEAALTKIVDAIAA